MPPIRVLVVDDSIVVRRLIMDVLNADPDVEVIDYAQDGAIGVQKAQSLKPDIITMDIEMPNMNGIQAVRAIRAAGIKCPIIMFSTLTSSGANATFEALDAGASDFVTKPGNVGTIRESMISVREAIIPKIKALVGRPSGLRGTPPTPRGERPQPAARQQQPGQRGTDQAVGRPGAARPGSETATQRGAAAGRPDAAQRPGTSASRDPQTANRMPRQSGNRSQLSSARVLLIGSSTGGPQALHAVLTALPATFPLPVLVTQHMPPIFTAQLAARLDRECKLRVVEAKDGDPVQPGTVLIAPGDYHMIITSDRRQVRVKLTQDPPENYCRPAVDPMFRSGAAVYGYGALAAVLTGMGSDGAKGAGDIIAAGGYVIAQDEATSTVWGMPGATVAANCADAIVPLPQISQAIMQRVPRPGARTQSTSPQGVTQPGRGA